MYITKISVGLMFLVSFFLIVNIPFVSLEEIKGLWYVAINLAFQKWGWRTLLLKVIWLYLPMYLLTYFSWPWSCTYYKVGLFFGYLHYFIPFDIDFFLRKDTSLLTFMYISYIRKWYAKKSFHKVDCRQKTWPCPFYLFRTEIN